MREESSAGAARGTGGAGGGKGASGKGKGKGSAAGGEGEGRPGTGTSSSRDAGKHHGSGPVSGSSGSSTTAALAPLERIRLVPSRSTPFVGVLKRLGLAMIVIFTMVTIVFLDRDGYNDNVGDGAIGLVDAVYYATVSLSTTGYGDIIPVTTSARLINAVLITPLRILFLLILIGTTLEALTERSRQEFRVARWRKHLHDHVVICGFGTKGRSAAKVITGPEGTPRDQVVVIDPDPRIIEEANQQGYAGVLGDATRKDILRQAEVARAKSVIVAPNRDDAAVLTVLTLRQLAPNVRIAASVREAENVALVQQSGADSVITSSEASGRLLGLSTESPTLVTVVEDLLVSGQGLDIEERQARVDEVGRTPRELEDLVLAVVRDETLLHFDDRNCAPLQPGDRVVVVKGHRGHLPPSRRHGLSPGSTARTAPVPSWKQGQVIARAETGHGASGRGGGGDDEKEPSGKGERAGRGPDLGLRNGVEDRTGRPDLSDRARPRGARRDED